MPGLRRTSSGNAARFSNPFGTLDGVPFCDSQREAARAEVWDAAEALDVDGEVLPAAATMEAAMADGAPQIHPDAPGNLIYDGELGDEENRIGQFRTRAGSAESGGV